MTRHLDSYILLKSIWGVPPACGPLLQLATAQEGQGNSPYWLQQNIWIKVTCHPVYRFSSVLYVNYNIFMVRPWVSALYEYLVAKWRLALKHDTDTSFYWTHNRTDACSGVIMKLEVFSSLLAIKCISVEGQFRREGKEEWAKFTALPLSNKGGTSRRGWWRRGVGWVGQHTGLFNDLQVGYVLTDGNQLHSICRSRKCMFDPYWLTSKCHIKIFSR